MNKISVTILSALLYSMSCFADPPTVSQLFTSMPDSIMPYLSVAQRKELIGIKTMEPDSVALITTSVGEIQMTRLSDDLLTLKLSDNSSFEIGRLDNDYFLLIKTYGAPLEESNCIIYNYDWKAEEVLHFSETDIQKPSDKALLDSLNKVINDAEFILVSASFTDIPQEIQIKFSIPLSYSDDNHISLKPYLQRNVKWINRKFN